MSVNQKDTFSDAKLQAEYLLQKASVKVDLFELNRLHSNVVKNAKTIVYILMKFLIAAK
jgi:hypothetical protein